jgi:LysM repeat protein
MGEDSELGIDDGLTKDRSYSEGRGTRMNDTKRLPVLLVIALILITVAGVVYIVTKPSTSSKSTPTETKGEETLASKVLAIEEKLAGLEAKITDLQGRSGKGGPDPFLLHQMEALTKRVEALEKPAKQPAIKSETRPPPPKPTVTSQKKYHTVQKGETLPKIGKKYGIAVEELRKLNNLSKGQSLKIGQKLLVSVER